MSRCFSLYRYATIGNNILLYPVLRCKIFLRVPVKITVHVLSAGFQLSYHKIYGFSLQCRKFRIIFFFAMKTYVVTPRQNRLDETVLLRSQNICLLEKY